MSKRTLGSLADLAKILEEAVDPSSNVREDRKEAKPKPNLKKSEAVRVVKVIDPKRKAWYDRRLREQAEPEVASAPAAPSVEQPPTPEVTKAAVSKVGGTLIQVLSAAKSPSKPKEGGKRPEAWRRKPGDPIF